MLVFKIIRVIVVQEMRRTKSRDKTLADARNAESKAKRPSIVICIGRGIKSKLQRAKLRDARNIARSHVSEEETSFRRISGFMPREGKGGGHAGT